MFEIGSKVKYKEITALVRDIRENQVGTVVECPNTKYSSWKNITWVMWPNEDRVFYSNTKDLRLADISEITEVKIIFNGKKRKRSRMVSVIFDEEIGITLHSAKKLYLCLIGPKSPKWLPIFNDAIESVREDMEYYKKAILNGVVDITIYSPLDNKNGKKQTRVIPESFCAFS